MRTIERARRWLLQAAPAVVRLCAASGLLTAAWGQSAVWTIVPPPPHPMSPYGDQAVAFDAARGQALYFGGTVTPPGGASQFSDQQWLWDGNSWSQSTVTPRPAGRSTACIAYDPVRQRVVMFGGADGSSTLGDTWEWNGQAWANVTAVGPSARYASAMVWDAARNAVVLFGGFFDDGVNYAALNDLWAWDGTRWTQITPTGAAPSGRSYPSVAYDSARSRLVVFGGFDNDYVAQQDLWEFDGAAWTQINPPGPRPTWVYAFANWMTFDSARGRSVLSVVNATGDAQETWEWDGAAWARVAPSPPANPPIGGPMTYDTARQRVLMVAPTQTWEWDGARWTNAAGLGPSARFGHGMTADTDGRPLLFGGGTNDTWRWTGARWEQILTPTAPSKRLVYSSMASYFDSAGRRHPMLFGGVDASENVCLDDTWEFTGVDWVRRATTGPSPRRLAGLADRGNIGGHSGLVLFGGVRDDLQQIYGDTWLYNHATQSWTDVTASIQGPTPSPRGTTMASRGDGGPPLLFGGLGGLWAAPTRFNDD